MIQIKDISYSYPNSLPVFEHFNWESQLGDAWAVLGPSGCGKTTLLYLLSGLIFPSSGKISIKGENINRPRPHTGLILQDYGLLPWATVRQNVQLGMKIRGFYGPDGKHSPVELNDGPQRQDIVESWLERLGLAPIAHKYPGQVSGGQRQRTAVARTLVLKPDLLLMDEPFSSLDAPTRESLQDLTRKLHNEHDLDVVIVTHSIEEAAVVGDKILLLTKPPNTTARIIENEGTENPDYRHSASYLERCHQLRGLMD